MTTMTYEKEEKAQTKTISYTTTTIDKENEALDFNFANVFWLNDQKGPIRQETAYHINIANTEAEKTLAYETKQGLEGRVPYISTTVFSENKV